MDAEQDAHEVEERIEVQRMRVRFSSGRITRDNVPSDCVGNFDNLHTLPRDTFRRHVVTLSASRMAHACRTLRDSIGC